MIRSCIIISLIIFFLPADPLELIAATSSMEWIKLREYTIQPADQGASSIRIPETISELKLAFLTGTGKNKAQAARGQPHIPLSAP